MASKRSGTAGKNAADLAKATKIWKGIEDASFYDEPNVEEVELVPYNTERMMIFAANTNYARQLPRITDSLKPVERRILLSLYKLKGWDKYIKSSSIIGEVVKIHNHADQSAYETMARLAQYWVVPVPYITSTTNLGTIQNPSPAAQRYTDAKMSKYAYECFFEDFEPDCVEMAENGASGENEPVTLPAKFPNMLVNGGWGMAFGNNFCVPTYNLEDICRVTKGLLKDPDYPDVYMIPDLPTGCDIVDDGSIKEIVETGKGTLRLRATSEILEEPKNWILRFHNIPWMQSLPKITDSIADCILQGKLQIKEVRDFTYAVLLPGGASRLIIDFQLIIDKAHDPYAVREKVYKLTGLGKSLSVNFKAVTEDWTLAEPNMRELLLSWINERRSYKRRLYNRRLTKIAARIDLLEILIYLLSAENIEKTVRIIRQSNFDEVTERLMKHGNMSSYQATKIANLPLNTFTKDARAKFEEELSSKKKQKADIMKIIGSEKRIDEIIGEELDELKKYAEPRKSNLVQKETGRKIPDTKHNLIISKDGFLKKLPYHENNPTRNATIGAFRKNDYPVKRFPVRNLDHLLMFNQFGRYSAIPVHEIETCEASNTGYSIYDVAKLDGEIVDVILQPKPFTLEYVKKTYGKNSYLVTLSRDGYIKKTPLEQYAKVKNIRNVRAAKLREDDRLVYADILLGGSNILIYTKLGKYIILPMDDISEQGKDAMGVIAMRSTEGDQCIGISVLGKHDTYVCMITEKGLAKKCELNFFGEASKRRGASSYLITLEPTDSLVYAGSVTDRTDLLVGTTKDINVLHVEDIPVLTRRAKGVKKVPVPNGSYILGVYAVAEKAKKKQL